MCWWLGHLIICVMSKLLRCVAGTVLFFTLEWKFPKQALEDLCRQDGRGSLWLQHVEWNRIMCVFACFSSPTVWRLCKYWHAVLSEAALGTNHLEWKECSQSAQLNKQPGRIHLNFGKVAFTLETAERECLFFFFFLPTNMSSVASC